jgi:hypothetical protein
VMGQRRNNAHALRHGRALAVPDKSRSDQDRYGETGQDLPPQDMKVRTIMMIHDALWVESLDAHGN